MPNFNLTISPSQIEYIVKPGVAITQAYQITNNSSNPLYLSTSIESWQPQGNDGSLTYENVLSNPNIEFSLNNSDLKLNQNFILPPNSSRQLVLKIHPQSQAGQSDYYYTLFINQASALDLESQAVAKVGSHILLSVSNTDQIPVNTKINNFSVSPKFKDVFFTPLTFRSEIENQTDYFFKTNGKITITKNDRVIKEINLKADNVLAHHTRSILCQADEQKPADTCTLKPPFWPGHYTATLSFDQSLSTAPTTVSFYIFPFSPIIAISLMIVLLVTIMNLYKSIKNNKNNKTTP